MSVPFPERLREKEQTFEMKSKFLFSVAGGLRGRQLAILAQARETTLEFINIYMTFETIGPNERTRKCGLREERGVRTESWCPPRFSRGRLRRSHRACGGRGGSPVSAAKSSTQTRAEI